VEKKTENQFVFKGEIVEVLNNPTTVKARIMCKPGTLIIEIPSPENYHLGDQVLVTGNFVWEKIENSNFLNNN
jgi:hypothetical protein